MGWALALVHPGWWETRARPAEPVFAREVSRLEPAPTLCSLFVFCHPNTTQHAPRHCFVYVQMRACVNGGSCVYTNTSTQVCMYLVCYVRCGNGFALQKTRELQIVAVLGDDTTGRRFPSLLLCVYPFLFFCFLFRIFMCWRSFFCGFFYVVVQTIYGKQTSRNVARQHG